MTNRVMKDWLNKFLSEFHRLHLKRLGYKKTHHTFSRDMGEYWERIQFQGSDSNGLYPHWKFYVNVGIEFKDIAPRRNWSGFAHTHWAKRIESLVPHAPAHWKYNQETQQEILTSELLSLFNLASERLAVESSTIKTFYLQNKT
jgi:hypothetical protein